MNHNLNSRKYLNKILMNVDRFDYLALLLSNAKRMTSKYNF
jgi:hypothetical protein